MKDLTRKRWFVFLLGILIAVIALLIFGLILYCNGYRIVYPERFETSWDAVSGFAAWFGVLVSTASAVASFMAVWYAVRVADKQNQIALFEKRQEIFNMAFSCRTFAEILSTPGIAPTKKAVQEVFMMVFYGTFLTKEELNAPYFVEIKATLLVNKLLQIEHLFNDRNVKYMVAVFEALSLVIMESFAEEEPYMLDEKIQYLLKIVNDDKYQLLLKQMANEISLK